jgi:hypothetical protein
MMNWDKKIAATGLFLIALVSGAAQKASIPPGLSVSGGELFLSGKPFCGIGANYFSLFYRTIKNPEDTSYKKELKRLSTAGIPFVRFMGCGFWPVDWELYLKDKEAYFKLLDGVVKSAEENHIGLIPSLFWYRGTLSDIVGESMDQLGNPESKTIAFIKKYTEEIVLRYRDSPAIWAWEFGNEYNLGADLPNAAEHRPKVRPKLGTALKRSERDDISFQHIRTAFEAFSQTVRKHDKHRIIITGNSIPRPSAFHNSTEKNWTPDTPEQFRQILLRDNPEPFDMISVHIYPEKEGKYPAHAKDLSSLVSAVQEIALNAKKPLFIGEFGVPANLDQKEQRALFGEILAAIEKNKVPLSAFWVFDLASQNGEWNVTFENERAFMIDLAAKANLRMKPLGP